MTAVWADRGTRQGILDVVMSKMSTQDLVDVRHVLDRDAVRRRISSDEAFVRANADFLRMDWLD